MNLILSLIIILSMSAIAYFWGEENGRKSMEEVWEALYNDWKKAQDELQELKAHHAIETVLKKSPAPKSSRPKKTRRSLPQQKV